ncbi:SLATT domain-containing protein [Roseivirga pacifica]|uniref:SLATT domain-containing protein n=1 Tax=Roseivirga pacifica TaxID=1267423 RepID=UPI003BAD5F53
MASTREVLDEWFNRVRVTQLAHYGSADHFGKRKYALGVPAVILSGIVGTTVFANLQNEPNINIQILVGFASVSAALLTSLQTFLGYSERAEKHRIAGAKYGALGRELELVRSFDSIDKSVIEDIKKRLDDLAQESPNNPKRIYYKAGAGELE